MKLFGVTGWKDSGKTTLVTRLVTHLTDRGFSVSTIKHAHHNFDIDRPGKDSYRHRQAGAREVLVSSGSRFALVHELRGREEPPLKELLAKLEPVDLVLVEGFKADRHDKIEVIGPLPDVTSDAIHRKDRSPIALRDNTIVALASDTPVDGLHHPLFGRDDVDAISDFIVTHVGLDQA